MYHPFKVKVSVFDPSTTVEVELPVHQEDWDSLVERAASDAKDQLIEIDYEFAEQGEEWGTCGGYIDYEGMSHDCNNDQAVIAYCMTPYQTVGSILHDWGMLEQLRDAVVLELETNHPEKVEQIQALKQIDDVAKAMLCASDWDCCDCEDVEFPGELWDKDAQICLIHCDYPLDLLDEIARRVQSSLESGIRSRFFANSLCIKDKRT